MDYTTLLFAQVHVGMDTLNRETLNSLLITLYLTMHYNNHYVIMLYVSHMIFCGLWTLVDDLKRVNSQQFGRGGGGGVCAYCKYIMYTHMEPPYTLTCTQLYMNKINVL